MALTPINYVVSEETVDVLENDEIIQPSRTWALDLTNGRIGGFIDGKEAIRQYIRKAVQTSRNRYLIYDDFYGSELKDLIGKDISPALLEVEIPRLVREAIIYDERIEDVPSVVITQYNADSIHIEITVELVDGELLTEGVEI